MLTRKNIVGFRKKIFRSSRKIFFYIWNGNRTIKKRRGVGNEEGKKKQSRRRGRRRRRG